MRIVRTTMLGLASLATAAWLAAATAAAGAHGPNQTAGAHQMPMAPAAKVMTKDQKIAQAMTAGPSAVTAKATILDWPDKHGAAPSVLRSGTNGWNCFPDMPDTQGTDPMCLDGQWMKWADAWVTKQMPQVTGVGIGYMTAPGGAWGSNTDPYATAKTATNAWHLAPPHIMIVVPDLKSLEGISTDPNNGGPYVMFAGTPYAHIMAPTSPARSGR